MSENWITLSATAGKHSRERVITSPTPFTAEEFLMFGEYQEALRRAVLRAALRDAGDAVAAAARGSRLLLARRASTGQGGGGAVWRGEAG